MIEETIGFTQLTWPHASSLPPSLIICAHVITQNLRWWQWGGSTTTCCFFKSDFSMRNGKCVSIWRHVGETCGDGWGLCLKKSGQIPEYDGHHLSCFDETRSGKAPRCIPSHAVSNPEDRNSCKWDFGGWWFLVTGSGDSCNGHACIFGGVSKCDYNTDNDW